MIALLLRFALEPGWPYNLSHRQDSFESKIKYHARTIFPWAELSWANQNLSKLSPP
jgi:hypothetical protein